VTLTLEFKITKKTCLQQQYTNAQKDT